jgi:hypothetical protein
LLPIYYLCFTNIPCTVIEWESNLFWKIIDMCKKTMLIDIFGNMRLLVWAMILRWLLRPVGILFL